MNILFYSRYVERGMGCRIEDTGGKGYSFFGKELLEHGCKINSYYDEIKAGTLEPYEILVIARPSNSTFLNTEIDEVRNFVKEGKGLFLLHDEPGDYGNKTNLNDISKKKFGIEFDEGLIGGCDDFKSGKLTRPIIHRFTKHPITKGVEKIWYWGCGVTGGTPIANANVCEKGITKNTAVIAATKCGSGKVVCIGSPWLFCNDERYYSPYYYDEFQLGLNIISWLGGKKSPMQMERWPFSHSFWRCWIRLKAFIRIHPDMFEWLTFILAIVALLLALCGLIPPLIQFI